VASNLLVRGWAGSFGVKATLSSCSNSSGPHKHVEKFLLHQITNAQRSGRPKLYGPGVNFHDRTPADDRPSAEPAILERGRLGTMYLVGTGAETSN
jgi:dTDP-glucose 4,6-dehydratase